LNLGCKDRFPWHDERKTHGLDIKTHATIEVTEAVREWDYGDYEGRVTKDIKADREKRGLGSDWDIWKDGCEGGESPEDVTARLDKLIHELREKYHKGKLPLPSLHKHSSSFPPLLQPTHSHTGRFGKDGKPNDVLIVAHGHILRSFAARWVGKKLEDNPSLILEAGGVGTLSYEHHSLEEPAILLGGAFVVDVVEKEQEEKKC
jgi:broad specificity phosphatase PhoE